MSFAVVINTCALAPHAATTPNTRGQSRHAYRAYGLLNAILPHYRRILPPEYIYIIGEWTHSNDWLWIPFESPTRTPLDALVKRHIACERAFREGAEWVLVQHDDHIVWDLDMLESHARCATYSAEVVSLARASNARDPRGEPLNNGAPDYVSGHAALYHRSALEAAPWSKVPSVMTWDVAHTQQLRAAGMRIAFSTTPVAWDIELGANPWA